MIVIRQHRIFRKDIQANRNVLYIFGDNLERHGDSGQAKEMRHEINSFGIAIKRRPQHGHYEDYFHDEEKDCIGIIDKEFERLLDVIYPNGEESTFKLYGAIIIPLDGIGTGFALLENNAPDLLRYINKKLKRLENI